MKKKKLFPQQKKKGSRSASKAGSAPSARLADLQQAMAAIIKHRNLAVLEPNLSRAGEFQQDLGRLCETVYPYWTIMHFSLEGLTSASDFVDQFFTKALKTLCVNDREIERYVNGDFSLILTSEIIKTTDENGEETIQRVHVVTESNPMSLLEYISVNLQEVCRDKQTVLVIFFDHLEALENLNEEESKTDNCSDKDDNEENESITYFKSLHYRDDEIISVMVSHTESMHKQIISGIEEEVCMPMSLTPLSETETSTTRVGSESLDESHSGKCEDFPKKWLLHIIKLAGPDVTTLSDLSYYMDLFMSPFISFSLLDEISEVLLKSRYEKYHKFTSNLSYAELKLLYQVAAGELLDTEENLDGFKSETGEDAIELKDKFVRTKILFEKNKVYRFTDPMFAFWIMALYPNSEFAQTSFQGNLFRLSLREED